MNRPGLERALSIVHHRMLNHELTLRNAGALDWPSMLTDRVLETQAARAEAAAIMDALEAALAEEPPEPPLHIPEPRI